MIIKKIIVLFIVIFFVGSLIGQKIIISGVDSNRNLVWTDFTGKVVRSSPFNAVTSYKINTKIEDIKWIGEYIESSTLNITVELDPIKSWVKEDKQTDELLKHEQGHFDIGILCVREILAKYKKTKFSKSNFSEWFKEICQEAYQKYRELGVLYDEETDHSKNKEQQKKWDTYFQEKLAASLTK